MRVLLADDQVWLRSALRLLLENEANTEVVGEAGNARALALLVPRLQPELLFLDWQLPGLDTNSARHHLITSLRKDDPRLFIIALTNDDKNPVCLRMGADAIVIQEDTKADGDKITILEAPRLGRHIRKAGLDFTAGDRPFALR